MKGLSLYQRGTEPLSQRTLEYHKKQFEIPYRSTVAFCDWLENIGCLEGDKEQSVIDIGSGMGANLAYMSKRFPSVTFTGIEKNPRLVKEGKAHLEKMKASKCTLVKGDIFNLPKKYRKACEGLISIQTLSWFPEFKTPLKKMVDLKPNWIALTSLFFDGRVDAKTIIRDYTSPQGKKPYNEKFYNVYSIPLVREFLASHGYEKFDYTPFEIDVNLPKPMDGMGTYTETLTNGRRIQISGPVLMKWYFIMAKHHNHE